MWNSLFKSPLVTLWEYINQRKHFYSIISRSSLRSYQNFPKFLDSNETEKYQDFYMMKTLTTSTIFLVFPLIEVLEILFGWLTCPCFLSFLNQWKFFEREFQDNFGRVLSLENEFFPKIQAMRKKLLVFYVGLPTCILMSSILLENLSKNFTLVNAIFTLLSTVQLVPRSLLEDSKLILSCKILEESYTQVNSEFRIWLIHLQPRIHLMLQPPTECRFSVEFPYSTRIKEP